MRGVIFIFLFIFLSNKLIFALKPDTIYSKTPAYYHYKFTEVKIPTSDGLSLNSWVFESDQAAAKPVTIVLAGSGVGNMSNYITYAAFLAKKGFRVVCFDYRGYGTSSPFKIKPSNLFYDEFSMDLLSVLKFVKSEHPRDLYGILGLSVGSIIAFSVTNKFNLDFIIAESPVFDPPVFAERLKNIMGVKTTLPASCGMVTDFVNNTKVPMLFIIGSDDDLSKAEDCTKLISGRGDRQIIIFNGGYLQGMPKLQTRYFDYISGFIDGLDLKNIDL